MLNRIQVNNCLNVENEEYYFENSHNVIKENNELIINMFLNLLKSDADNEIVDETKEASIKLYFVLNKAQIDYISSYLVLDSNYLVVLKLINNGSVHYFINEKNATYQNIKSVLNYLIDYHKIINSIGNNHSLAVLDNYILKNDEEYSLNKYNYLRLDELRKQYSSELQIINDNSKEDNIKELLAIKNDIESFELEKGEIEYINKEYEKLNSENKDKSNIEKVLEVFNEGLNKMKDVVPTLEELENSPKLKEEAIALEQAFFNLKQAYDEFNDHKNDENDENSSYIIDRYNKIKEFQAKYGNTYKEIIAYYHSINAKINYYRYSKVNAKNIEEKINTLNLQLDKLKQNLILARKNYSLKIIDYFNKLIRAFDTEFSLDVRFNDEVDLNDTESVNFIFLLNNEEVSLKELKEYDNYYLISLIFSSIFLIDEDKTIIVNDDFSTEFNQEQNMIYIKILNTFKSCLVLSDNEYLA